MAEKISVVIPVVNNANKIGKCLESVLNQSIRPYEVIVVDGHSTDGTPDVVKGFPVKLVFEDYHTRAGALQMGVDEALGEFIAFTDADCIPDKNWLQNLILEFHEGIVGVGGRFNDIGTGLWTRSINLTFQTPFSGARSRWTTRKEMKRLSVCGASGMVSKKNIVAVGGFKTNLKGGEDLEFSTRLSKLGRLIYTPDAVILHDHDRGLLEFIKKSYRYGKDRREARLFDSQAIVAFVAPFMLLSAIYSWVVLAVIAGLYVLLAVTIGLLTARQNKEAVFVVSVPLAFASQHLAFIAGFWKQVFKR